MPHEKATKVFVCSKLPWSIKYRCGMKDFEIKGINSLIPLDSEIPQALPTGKYAITEWPRDVWEQFIKVMHDQKFILNGAIFASFDQKSAESTAKSFRTVRSGLEGIDPDKPHEVDPDIKKFSAKDKAG